MTIPATQLSQNQFAQTPVQGEFDLRFTPATISAQIDVSSLGSLIPGQPVKRVNSAGGIPKVVECSLASDDIFGFIGFDIKSQVFNVADRVELAVRTGSVMYMTSAGAIDVEKNVEVVIGSVQVQQSTPGSGNRIIGKSFDKATGAGQLIRVWVDMPGALA